jgi:hypothetical protein
MLATTGGKSDVERFTREGEAFPMSEESSNGAPEAAPAAEATPESEPKTVAYPRMKSALALVKRNPLKAVALGAAAIASLEVELAVGILAGIGATALLTTKPGAEAREEVVSKGKAARDEVVSKSKAARDEVVSKSKAALDKAKTALKRKAAPAPVVSAGDAPPAAPPS